MPTWIPNVNCIVSIDNSVPTLTDQSDYISTISLEWANSIAKFGTFGLAAKQKSEGDADWTGQIGIRPATDNGGAHDELIDWITPTAPAKPGLRSLRIQEPDAAVGSFQWDGEIYGSSYNVVNQDADGDGSPNIRNFGYEVDGQPSLTVIT